MANNIYIHSNKLPVKIAPKINNNLTITTSRPNALERPQQTPNNLPLEDFINLDILVSLLREYCYVGYKILNSGRIVSRY